MSVKDLFLAVLVAFLSFSVFSETAVSAPRGMVIDSNSSSQFVHVPGRFRSKALACRINGKRLIAGFKEKRLDKGTVFISFRVLARKAIAQEKKKISKASRTTRLRCALYISRGKGGTDDEEGNGVGQSTATPTSTPTNTSIPGASPTPSSTPTGTLTATPTATNTGQPTATNTPTKTNTPTNTPTYTPTNTPTPSATPIRINAGGSNYTDSGGKLWKTDIGSPWISGESGTYDVNNPISNTVEDPLYQTERYTTGDFFSYTIPVQNGKYDINFHFAEIAFSEAGVRKFDVTVEGTKFLDDFDIFAQAGGQYVALIVPLSNVEITDGAISIEFTPSFSAGGQRLDNPKVSALEIAPSPGGDPFLHVVMNGPPYRVDYNSNGSESYPLDGSTSHTHEPGRTIVEWEWKKGANILGTAPSINPTLPLGGNVISLTIGDDGNPQRTLTDSKLYTVYPIYSVGGLLAKFYPNANPVGIIDNLPSTPGFEQTLESSKVTEKVGKVESSPYNGDVVVQLLGEVDITSSGSYTFSVTGGAASRVYVDGQLITGPKSLSVGRHQFEVRYAVTTLNTVPAYVSWKLGSGNTLEIPKDKLYHDETGLKPFINTMKQSGSTVGGETIRITGLGYFPPSQVKVRWGTSLLTPTSIEPESLLVTSPAGTGNVQVRVETPNGNSNEKTFTYISGDIPILFESAETVATAPGVTQIAWGPDGRLYVAAIDGTISALTLDEDYELMQRQDITTINGLSNNAILGITFNPLDPPSPVKIYVSHSALFQNGGACYSGFSPYSGQVSMLTGPTFNSIQPLITGLPVSNHDHGVNGLQFDNYGNLLISQGGNTNAGVHNCGDNCCNIGNVPESPLSAAVLLAPLFTPGFDGALSYVETANGTTNNDQTFGHLVDLAAGKDVQVFAPGLRNSFDIVWSTRSVLYGTDNGPNVGFGNASTGANTQGPDPQTDDKILLLLQDHYYGHANRNRGRKDTRQNIYRNAETASPIRGIYTAPLGLNPPSTDGIDEYRSTTFQNGMRGNLLIQRFGGGGTTELMRVGLTSDGRFIDAQEFEEIPTGGSGLDVLSGPGGAILVSDYHAGDIKVLKPNDQGVGAMQGYDIFPWRSLANAPFVIGGSGFGGTTTVTIGGVSAQVTHAHSNHIEGIIPVRSNPTSALLDVVINSNGLNYTIPKAFRYLLPNGTGKGVWAADTISPTALGEIAAGIVNGVLYAVGSGSTQTLAFDFSDGTWTNSLAVRPNTGEQSAAEVINNKLYLFGGLGSSSGNKVQIYDPSTNAWSQGAQIPVTTSSSSTALINGKIYLAGGTTDGTNALENAYKYDPSTNAWSAIAPMPSGKGRFHAAAGTDGNRLYIFGGKNGATYYGDVLIYNPATNTWQANVDNGQSIPALPLARGGTGKAVYLNGEFYIIAGETSSSVVKRVDVYNPLTRTWRLETDLITQRQGSFPLGWNGRIIVPLGATAISGSLSKINEYFYR